MLERLRPRLSPQFLTFIVARLAGVGVKPLVLLVATLAMRERFAQDYALLVSALAGLFVLAGAQTHIAYYKHRFSEGANAYYHAYRSYLSETLLQYLLVLPFVGLVALLWTQDPVILASILLLVGVEKFFDEDMRHFLFTRRYYGWSLSFAFRTVVPAFAVLVLLPLWEGRLIVAYTAIVLASLVIYGLIRSRHFRFYLAQIGLFARGMRRNGREVLARFAGRWRRDLMFNQMWSFASVNVLLIDRLLVANLQPTRLDEYVFFANIFNLANVAHSLLYFMPRRPELIRDADATAWREISRPANLLPPLLYAAVSVAIALAIRHTLDVYQDISLILLGGLALFYLLQAINLVGIEYVFWRVDRKWLLLCDTAIIAAVATTVFALRPPLEFVPFITTVGLVVRLFAYQAIARSGASTRTAKPATISPD